MVCTVKRVNEETTYMSDRSGKNDTDNGFAGISFEGVNAVPPQSGENGDTINLADVADVSEQDDVSHAAVEFRIGPDPAVPVIPDGRCRRNHACRNCPQRSCSHWCHSYR